MKPRVYVATGNDSRRPVVGVFSNVQRAKHAVEHGWLSDDVHWEPAPNGHTINAYYRTEAQAKRGTRGMLIGWVTETDLDRRHMVRAGRRAHDA
jgi:hypothetical protein